MKEQLEHRLEELGFISTKEALQTGEDKKIIIKDINRWYSEGLFEDDVMQEVLSIVEKWN
jgi:hypothetical protein